ncbi:MAG: hypothetical protein H7X93_06590 [Sphingomonadaceae bacterium]|nr:hypothetical protein [Sphingomonadaceae bacterium]
MAEQRQIRQLLAQQRRHPTPSPSQTAGLTGAKAAISETRNSRNTAILGTRADGDDNASVIRKFSLSGENPFPTRANYVLSWRMDKVGNSPRARRLDEAAKQRFLTALAEGASVLDAARAGGVGAPSFYRERDRDEAFFRAWAEAIDAEYPPIIRPGRKRRLQRRRFRRLRFDAARRAIFLSHFAGSCNLRAAAKAADVTDSTVSRHRAEDAEFAAAFDQALEQGYVRLEAELLAQRLEAQRRLRDEPIEARAMAGEPALEFDQAMKMLTRWDRRGGGIGPRAVSHGHRRRMSFDEAIEALAKRLRALDIPIVALPAPGAETK